MCTASRSAHISVPSTALGKQMAVASEAFALHAIQTLVLSGPLRHIQQYATRESTAGLLCVPEPGQCRHSQSLRKYFVTTPGVCAAWSPGRGPPRPAGSPGHSSVRDVTQRELHVQHAEEYSRMKSFIICTGH
jgi:hypothetical protein